MTQALFIGKQRIPLTIILWIVTGLRSAERATLLRQLITPISQPPRCSQSRHPNLKRAYAHRNDGFLSPVVPIRISADRRKLSHSFTNILGPHTWLLIGLLPVTLVGGKCLPLGHRHETLCHVMCPSTPASVLFAIQRFTFYLWHSRHMAAYPARPVTLSTTLINTCDCDVCTF